MKVFKRIALVLLLLLQTHGFSAELPELLTLDEFRQLASELSPKVDLFAATWQIDPSAAFFGGTTRDYLYWLKNQLKSVETRQEALAIAEKLRARPVIYIREFLAPHSDVDIVSNGPIPLDPDDFIVSRIETVRPDRFDSMTPSGQTELDQGYLPTEKIRLDAQGFLQWTGSGDGVAEIHDGHITVHYAPPSLFWATHYAALRINHPILLALRFLRALAIEGTSYEDADPESKRLTLEVLSSAAKGMELRPFLEKPKFREWVNTLIRKAFRSAKDTQKVKELFDAFRVDRVVKAYPRQIAPYARFVETCTGLLARLFPMAVRGT